MNVQRQMMTKFIDLYSENACLWDPNHINYKDKFERTKALEGLLEIYKEFDPEANVDSVRNKINTIRSVYNKEKKKIMARPDYRTYLWYYEKLNFLEDIVTPSEEQIKKHAREQLLDQGPIRRTSISNKYSQPERRKHTPCQDDSDNDSVSIKRSRKDRVQDSDNIKFEIEPFDSENSVNASYLDESGEDYCNNQQSTERVYLFDQHQDSQCSSSQEARTEYQDEIDSFASTVAISLRKLKHPQQAIAQKLISDVLFYSKLDKLTENTTISIPQ